MKDERIAEAKRLRKERKRQKRLLEEHEAKMNAMDATSRSISSEEYFTSKADLATATVNGLVKSPPKEQQSKEKTPDE